MPKYTVTHGAVSRTPMGGVVEMTAQQAADINASGVCLVLVEDSKPEPPKHSEPKPELVTEFAPAVEAKKPRVGKDKYR